MVNPNAGVQAVIDQAVADIAAAQGAEESAVLLISRLLAQVSQDAADLAAAGVNVTALQATLATFEAATAPLAAAVAANP